LLTIVLSNLFDNAVTYANEAGQISIRAFAEGSAIVFIVQNTGSQVEGVDVEKVFQRFWRGDAARSANDRHAGLGLALCKRIATILGGAMEAKTEKGADFEMRLTLPLNPS
jgi:signal transduction histidine kinase